MRYLLTCLITGFLFFQGICQDGVEMPNEYNGTYVIEVLGRSMPLIPENIEEIVGNQRKKNEIVYVSIGTNARIKVLSQTQINSSAFEKLKYRVVNVESFNL